MHRLGQNANFSTFAHLGNPSGAVISLETMKYLIELSDEHNFVIVSDECYSEIYHRETSPPPGILQACDKLNRRSYKNCLVFNSLSKRSNLPGLRSGFVAGDAELIENFLLIPDLPWLRDAVASSICKCTCLGRRRSRSKKPKLISRKKYQSS